MIECSICGMKAPSSSMLRHQNSRFCKERKRKNDRPNTLRSQEYKLCECRFLVSTKPSDYQAHITGGQHEDGLKRTNSVLESIVIECWCGAPYVKSQWKYHISSEQHCENYKKMRRIGYIPFKEYRLTAPIHNESPRLHGATLRPMHDRIRLYNMMDNYFCTEICNAVNSNPNRFNGPVMKSLITNEQFSREVLCLLQVSYQTILGPTAYAQGYVNQLNHLVDLQNAVFPPMRSMSKQSMLSFIQRVGLTNYRPQFETLKEEIDIERINPSQLLDYPLEELARSSRLLDSVPNQSQSTGIHQQSQVLLSRQIPRGISSDEEDFQLERNRSTSNMPMLNRILQYPQRIQSAGSPAQIRYNELLRLVGSEGLSLMQLNNCIFTQDGRVMASNNTELTNEEIKRVCQSHFAEMMGSNLLENEDSQSSHFSKRQEYLRHRDINGNPVFQDINNLPDV